MESLNFNDEILINNTNFHEQIYNKLKHDMDTTDNLNIKNILFDYQTHVFNYLSYPQIRGLLIIHSTGTGKTITSISVAEHFRKMDRDVIVLSGKSLKDNYIKEIKTFNKSLNKDISDLDLDNIVNSYKFVSSNSSNMIKQLQTFDNKFEEMLSDVNKVSLDNKIIVIDEAHLLMNSIANGAIQASMFYDLVMKAKNIKLLLLTASPIVNTWFELVPALNMCFGRIELDTNDYSQNKFKQKKEYTTILPEYFVDFKRIFFNESDNSIKNIDKFKNRITGLVSYHGDLFTSKYNDFNIDQANTIKKKDFPDRLPIIINTISMNVEQNAEYINARDKERMETAFKYMQGGAITKEQDSVSTSYRVKSRQLCNVYIDFNNNIISPKIEAIINNIDKNKKIGSSLVYSSFIKSGINIIEHFLKIKNFIKFNLNDYKLNINKTKTAYTYAVFSGDIDIDERAEIIKIFNSPENKHGTIINSFLITSVGAQGLDLKNIRYIYITEPFFNYSRLYQVFGRGIRYKSHDDLDEKNRNVQIYIYLSDYNKNYLEVLKNKIKDKIKLSKESGIKLKKSDITIEKTTDIYLLNTSLNKKKINDQFIQILSQVSIDCKFYNTGINFDCYKCKPNNKQLYHPDIERDIQLPNACDIYTKIQAEEVIINSKKYYYTIDKVDKGDIEIYEFDKNIDGYIKVIDETIITKIKNKLKI